MRQADIKANQIKVDIYSKSNCHLCEVAKDTILKVKRELDFVVREIDIQTDAELFEKYKEEIPVIYINNKKSFKYKVDEKEFRKKLERLLKQFGK